MFYKSKLLVEDDSEDNIEEKLQQAGNHAEWTPRPDGLPPDNY